MIPTSREKQYDTRKANYESEKQACRGSSSL
jgi:hypothetical protein